MKQDLVNTAYWQNPPWRRPRRGGPVKHRLGLSRAQQWPLQPISVAMRAFKTELLEQRYEAVVGVTQDGARAQQVLLSAPRFAAARAGAERFPHAIAAAALQFDDDLCLLDLQAQQRLVAACVCAPSYWRLLDKLGLPLTQIHQPVQGLNAEIGAAVQRFISNMPAGVAFQRANWFVHGDGELFHAAAEQVLDSPPQDWWMRSEYQTLFKLCNRYVLFAIRIVCEPLPHIMLARAAAAKADLRYTLQLMNGDEVAHFGGAEKRRKLLKYLSA